MKSSFTPREGISGLEQSWADLTIEPIKEQLGMLEVLALSHHLTLSQALHPPLFLLLTCADQKIKNQTVTACSLQTPANGLQG